MIAGPTQAERPGGDAARRGNEMERRDLEAGRRSTARESEERRPPRESGDDASREESDLPAGPRVSVLRLTPHFYWPQLRDSSWPVKFDAIGGMQSQIYRLTRALAGLGVEQRVLTLRIRGAPREWSLSDGTTVHGVRVPVLPLRSRIRGMVDLNLAWALGVVWDVIRWRPRPTVLHVHCSGVILPPLVGWILSRLLRTPLVLTLHCSILATYHPMSRLDSAIQPIARWIERRAIRASERVVVLTPRSVSALARAAGVTEDRFVVLPDVIDADEFAARASPEAQAEMRARWAIPEGVPVVGYVGRIAREKGWPILLDIAERLRDMPLHWLICGDGNERDLFEADVAARGLADRVTVTGYIANEDVPNAMGIMDLLLMASLHEEFGSVMLEAMAVRLPIVAYSVGGIAAVLEHGALGVLVPERTSTAFAAAIRETLASPETRAQLAERAAARVREAYHVDRIARDTQRVYRAMPAETPVAAAF